MVGSVLCYGSEKEEKCKFIAVEMDYLQRSARVIRLQHVMNDKFKIEWNPLETVIQSVVEKRGLQLFGHLFRMDDTRCPKHLSYGETT